MVDAPQTHIEEKDISHETIETGPEVIKSFVRTLPNLPGVYRMLNKSGDVLYVGKAKSLKNRVTSYTRLKGQSNRIARMISQTASMEFMTTETEVEALLLEANLIKQLKPHFNVLMRDDKSFPYILITEDHEAPQLMKHRGARKREGDYFGPFASAGAVSRTVAAMERAFLLRTCSNSEFDGRTRPCLNYQIKRCSGPCTGEIDEQSYRQLVNDAKGFLSGKSNKIKSALAERMEEASNTQNYEKAAVLRDRLQALAQIQSHQSINPRKMEEADVFAIHQDAGQACIQVFFFRNWQNWGNHAYYPRADKSYAAEDILEAFLAQFYDNKPIPRLILLSDQIGQHDLFSQALSSKAGRKITIETPQRGEKNDLVKHALDNARAALGRKLAETSSQNQLLAKMAETFDLPNPPRRIEVYDNSHIQGTNAVGAMIVAGKAGFIKNQYRKFNIKSENLTPGDDFGMMREVLTRRFERLIKEHGLPEKSTNGIDDSANMPDEEDQSHMNTPAWPDLLLIDGGKGQLSSAIEVLEELGIDKIVTAIGIAKGPQRNAGRETFFKYKQPSITLPERDPVLYYTQRLRDEAHRFAIGTHRKKRSKDMLKNPLDDVPGIGAKRKRALLNAFGSAGAVTNAGLSDLEAVEGISDQLARTIYDYFHEQQSS